MLLRWVFSFGVCAFVQFVIFMNAYSNRIFANISGVIFMFVYFAMLFDGAAKLGKLDNKPYTPLKYDVRKSVLWGVIIAAICGITIVIYKLNQCLDAPNVIVNILFFVIQSPFMAFTIIVPNYFPWWIVVLSIAIPILACVVGYVLGRREFWISDKLHNLMFEKGKKDI